MPDKPQHPRSISIHINGQRFEIEIPITGAELRSLGAIPEANQLFLEAPGPEPDVLIVAAQSYELKNGSHLYDLPKGTVGATDRAAQLAYAKKHLSGASLSQEPDGRALLRWRSDVGPRWAPENLELLLEVPSLYPAQAPSGFDVVGSANVDGRLPSGTGGREINGVPLLHFCWNPAGAIAYPEEDGLWRFAKFAETRFKEAA